VISKQANLNNHGRKIIYVNGWTRDSVLKRVQAKFKGKSMDSFNSTCLYLGVEGKRCVVGLFIPDNHIALNARAAVSNLLEEFPDLEQFMPMDRSSLSSFQYMHDQVLDVESLLAVQIETLVHWITENSEVAL
jgi:hypothetical protein